MIADKFVDLYARNSGLKDKLVAERDVVLTYALRALVDNGVMAHLAFKGGTCLRKTVFGSAGRFSEDLDFTLASDREEDDVLVELVDSLNGDYHGVRFKLDEYYKADGDTSFGGTVLYRHSWNNAGRFRLQVSLRERPTLAVREASFKQQAYFTHLEFPPFRIRSLEPVEMIAEKVRATFQRAKVRDLYDLYRFSSMPLPGDLLRHLVVLKLWQVRDTFDPEALFEKIRSGAYDFDDLRRLLRSGEEIRPDEMIGQVERSFGFLRNLSELETQLIADARSGWNEPLAERVREVARGLFTG